MKKLLLVTILSFTLLATATEVSQKVKPLDDPCPKGTHEVIITEQYKFLSVKNKKETPSTSKETKKVCRDIKDTALIERSSN